MEGLPDAQPRADSPMKPLASEGFFFRSTEADCKEAEEYLAALEARRVIEALPEEDASDATDVRDLLLSSIHPKRQIR